MARITVEDCIDKFPSRFELVLVASNRARKLHSGETPTVEKDNDKNTVIALREIAQETLTKDQLKNDLIEEYQTTTFSEDEDLEESDSVGNNQDVLADTSVLETENNVTEENISNEDNEEDDFKTEEVLEAETTETVSESDNIEEQEITNSEEVSQQNIEENKTD